MIRSRENQQYEENQRPTSRQGTRRGLQEHHEARRAARARNKTSIRQRGSGRTRGHGKTRSGHKDE
jgi:hypothetical protein